MNKSKIALALALFAILPLPCAVSESDKNIELHLSRSEADLVGKKIWQNECSGSIEGLSSWNKGEEFPSLGIGHFIWYPEGVRGPFDESFPRLLGYLKARGTKLPDWLSPDMACPWTARSDFLNEHNGKRLTELRSMLSSTVALQTDFIVQRLEAALPKMLEAAPAEKRKLVEKQFKRMLKGGPSCVFALIDYVNFKGEGVLETERYKGEGWGLLQVLSEMSESGKAAEAFSASARKVLSRRVANSPPERHEERWLPGWNRRVNDYSK
ncbi:MAG: hypothetical protein K2X27_17145 [Candidatus Obscuribacterales bacterium]|nr:hypothetical protein [Candidatus Obscuribacterales bacterium]